jgi:hypothetical protein
MYTVQLKTNNHRNVILNDENLKLFQAQLRGKLFLPEDFSFPQVSKIWNGMIDKKPGMVVVCRCVADILEAVKFARMYKIELAVKGCGHSVAGHSLSDGGMVIDLSELKGIRVDPFQRTVRAEAGVTLGELDHETQAFGLATPLGVVSDTGIAGLTLGGGIGWLSRKYGLTIDNLLSVDIVTADGRFIKASAQENTDLFWALKGGGGNFGIVTSFEYRLHPVGPDIWTLHTIYPLEKAQKIFGFVREYMEKAPEELGLITIYWTAPNTPDIPVEVQGETVILFLGCYHGPFEKGEEVLQPFRELDAPLIDRSAPMKYTEFQKVLDEDYPEGRKYYWKSLYLADLPPAKFAEAIEVLNSYATQRPSSLTSLDLWSLKGAISRVELDKTPFALREAPFLLGIEANWDDPAQSAANVAWAQAVYKHMQRFSLKGSYLNFPGLVEEQGDMLKGTFGPNYKRLLEVKAKYDPYNFFRNNVNIPVL